MRLYRKKANYVLIAPCSAIPSWQGYEYQGHIALYVVLKKIKTLLDNDLNNSNSNYSLEIEGVEDFSILNGESYESLHQVKAGSFSLNDIDKFCFLVSILQYKVNKGFYHVKNNKNIPTDFVEETIKIIKERRQEFSERNEIDDQKINSNSTKGSKYQILKCLLDDPKSKYKSNVVDEAIKEILTELNEYENMLFYEGNPISDEKYVNTYPELFDCTTDVIKSSCDLIFQILDMEKPDFRVSISSEDIIAYDKFVYGQLLIYLKEKITLCYEQRKSRCLISFDEIYNVVIKDYRSQLISIGYQYYMVWNSMKDSFEKYPQKTELCSFENCIECTNKAYCNLEKQRRKIFEIKEEKENIHDFLHKIMLKKPEKGRSNNLPNDNLIMRLMISLLKKIDCLDLGDNNIIQARKNNKFYRLTLDNSDESKDLQKQLLKEISHSVEDLLLLYEHDILITNRLDDEFFSINGQNISILGENERREIEDITSDSVEKLKINYNKPKILELININTAKEKLI